MQRLCSPAPGPKPCPTPHPLGLRPAKHAAPRGAVASIASEGRGQVHGGREQRALLRDGPNRGKHSSWCGGYARLLLSQSLATPLPCPAKHVLASVASKGGGQVHGSREQRALFMWVQVEGTEHWGGVHVCLVEVAQLHRIAKAHHSTWSEPRMDGLAGLAKSSQAGYLYLLADRRPVASAPPWPDSSSLATFGTASRLAAWTGLGRGPSLPGLQPAGRAGRLARTLLTCM